MKITRLFVRSMSAFVLAASAFVANAAESVWVPVSSGVKAELSGIACAEPRTCFAVAGLYLSGGSGALVKTTDGGVTFSKVSIPTLNPFHAIRCPTAKVCYSAGDFGTFLKTEDGGATWTDTQLGSKASPPQLTALAALDEHRVFVGGKDGLMLRTRDGGAHWTPVSLRTVADITDIYFIDQKKGFVVGNDGILLNTTDGGDTWTATAGLRDTGTTRSLRGVPGGQTLFAVGDSIRRSTDGGATWAQVGKDLAKPFPAVAVAGENIAYALSGIGVIVKTTDGGATWAQELSSPSTILRGLVCPTADYCLAAGSYGTIFRRGVAPEPPPPAPPPPPEPAPATTTAETAPTIPSTEPAPAPVPPAPLPIPPAPAPEPTPPAPPTTPGAIPSEKPVSAKAAVEVFTRSLKKGFHGADVKKLQELLAGVGGVYPEATVSGFFGEATRKAVGRFQEKYELAKPGEAGYGIAGPKTRAKLIDAAVGQTSETAPPAAEPDKPPATVKAVKITRTLKKGMWSDEVKRLQKVLAADAELYPEGEVSGYFGHATQKAVGRFQEKYNIVSPGEPGYGEVGPKTRAKLAGVEQ